MSSGCPEKRISPQSLLEILGTLKNASDANPEGMKQKTAELTSFMRQETEHLNTMFEFF